ncbi:hypothetical protein C8R45DRAFT_1157541 [Mycena sanguinolenta]|nr:hypothetical protein C8R45DRAFT_1157541 [Mycena sanguinolenta]
MAPLVIRADLNKADGVELKTILRGNIQRLGTLELHFRQARLADFLYDVALIDATAPRLQYLKLVNTTARDGVVPVLLPPDLLSGSDDKRMADSTAQFSLYLEGCAFGWDSVLYSQITHLHLEDLILALRPTMEELLTILVGSPALQTLSLIHCPPTTFDGFSVDLPHLSALTIRSNSIAPTSVQLLTYLILHPSVMIHISLSAETVDDDDDDDDNDDYDDDGIPIASLILSFCPFLMTYDTIRVIQEDSFAYYLLDSMRPWWSYRFQFTGGDLEFCEATRALINTLDLSTITVLHFVGSTAASTGVVVGQHLHRVQTLHLHVTAPASWLDFLFTQAMFVLGFTHWKYKEHGLSSRGADGSLTDAWAGLQCLSLHGLDLGHDLRGTSKSLQPTRSAMLRALLWARREGGTRISQLEIEGCWNVSNHDLQHFRLFVDLKYDGKGLKITTEEDYESLRSYAIGVLARMLEALNGVTDAVQ